MSQTMRQNQGQAEKLVHTLVPGLTKPIVGMTVADPQKANITQPEAEGPWTSLNKPWAHGWRLQERLLGLVKAYKCTKCTKTFTKRRYLC